MKLNLRNSKVYNTLTMTFRMHDDYAVIFSLCSIAIKKLCSIKITIGFFNCQTIIIFGSSNFRGLSEQSTLFHFVNLTKERMYDFF